MASLQLLMSNVKRGPGNPGSIGGLQAWFKASQFDAGANGNDIATLVDSSSVATNAASICGAGNQFTIDNAGPLAYTTFDGSSKRGYSRALSIAANTDWTVFLVLKFTADGEVMGTNDGASTGFRFGRSAGVISMTYSSVAAYSTNESIDTSPHYIVLVSNGGTVTPYVDGVAYTWASTPGVMDATALTSLKVGEGYSGLLFSGKVAEMAMYDGAVSGADRTNNLEAYASIRYGI